MRRAKRTTIGIALLICIATVNLAFADPTISTDSLPDALLNTSYNTTVNANGGTQFSATVVDGEYGDWGAGSGYQWTLSAGALPAGMNLQTTNPNGTGDFEWYDQGYNYYTARLPGQIKIVGSPTQTGVVTFTLTAHCFGGANVSKQFTITVGTNQLNITTASLPPNDINYAYSATVNATGGTTPYIWSITNGSLPAGLSLNSSAGVIAGTPTASGTSNFTVQVTSNDSQTATKALSIYIAPTIS
ncbi:MAG: putative Ig domain-containing protein, partial [Planctomycetes bacterium]|nr:putative Ig domain-containing protein [Planctomycetota bacterium]